MEFIFTLGFKIWKDFSLPLTSYFVHLCGRPKWIGWIYACLCFCRKFLHQDRRREKKKKKKTKSGIGLKGTNASIICKVILKM